MPITYTETDTNSGCSTGHENKAMAVGGPAGSTELSFACGSSQGNKNLEFHVTPGVGVTWGAGTITIRANCTTAEMNATGTPFVQRKNSSCVNQENLVSGGSGIFDLSTTGVKTVTRTLSAATSPASTDILMVRITLASSSHTATVGITPSEDIDAPFSAALGVDEAYWRAGPIQLPEPIITVWRKRHGLYIPKRRNRPLIQIPSFVF
jgi:hypothetical protein